MPKKGRRQSPPSPTRCVFDRRGSCPPGVRSFAASQYPTVTSNGSPPSFFVLPLKKRASLRNRMSSCPKNLSRCQSPISHQATKWPYIPGINRPRRNGRRRPGSNAGFPQNRKPAPISPGSNRPRRSGTSTRKLRPVRTPPGGSLGRRALGAPGNRLGRKRNALRG